jgi:hypothetical protein
MNTDYGACDICGTPLQVAWFIDKEFYPNSNTPTGRTKFAIDFLYCPYCGKQIIVDDSFDKNWSYPY